MPRTKKAPKRTVYPTDGLATVNEACRFLKISRDTAYKLMKTEEIPWVPLGGFRRISWEWLHKKKAETRKASKQPA